MVSRLKGGADSASKRRNFLRGIGASTTLGLAGCLGLGGSSQQKLHFFAEVPNSEGQKTLRSAFEEWKGQRDDNVKLQFEFVPTGETMSKLSTYFGSGNPPDLLLTSSSPPTIYFERMASVRDPMEANNLPKSMFIEYDGKVVLHPIYLDGIPGRWYRKDIYDEAGVKSPKTWDEHTPTLKKLNDHLPDGQYPELFLANPNGGSAMWMKYATQFRNMGVDFIERTGPGLDEVRVSLGDNRQAALDVLNYLSDKYQFSPESISWGWKELVLAYVNETVATAHYPGRIVTNVQAQNPKIADATKIAPPVLPPETNVDDFDAFGVFFGFSTPKETNTGLATDFMEWFMGTDYYFDVLLSVAPHYIPVRKKDLDDKRVKQNEVWQSVPEYRQWAKDLLPRIYPAWEGRTDPPTPYYLDLVYTSNIQPEMVASVLLGDKTPEQAVDDATKRLEEKLPDYKKQYGGE